MKDESIEELRLDVFFLTTRTIPGRDLGRKGSYLSSYRQRQKELPAGGRTPRPSGLYIPRHLCLNEEMSAYSYLSALF